MPFPARPTEGQDPWYATRETYDEAIETAIEKVVSGEGLPSRIRGVPAKLEDYAISMPTTASSGRETEKKLQ